MATEKDRRVLVFVGVTGVGKSTSCNVLAGQEFTGTSEGFESATQTAEHIDVSREDLAVRIVDTVGFLDNRMNEREKQAKFAQFADRASFGVDIFHLVFKDGRFTEQDERCFKLYKEVMGKEALKHTTIVFTHITDERLQQKLSAQLPSGLRSMLKEVDNRVVGVENTEAEQASASLFAVSKKLLAANDGRRYSNKILQAAMQRREALDRRIEQVENSDRRAMLRELRVGLNNGTRTIEMVERHVAEAEAAEAKERNERQQLEEARRKEQTKREKAEHQATAISGKSRLRSTFCPFLLLLCIIGGVVAGIVISKHSGSNPGSGPAPRPVSCPRSVHAGECNGHGSCDHAHGTCSCHYDSYKDDDDLCYPTPDCEHGGQRGHRGQCVCLAEQDGFGWAGPTCSDPCGSKTFRAGTHEVWGVHWGNWFLNSDKNSATCWCRRTTGMDQITGSPNSVYQWHNTYGDGCYTKNKICDGWNGGLGCNCVSEIKCYMSGYDACPADSIFVKRGQLHNSTVDAPRVIRIDVNESMVLV